MSKKEKVQKFVEIKQVEHLSFQQISEGTGIDRANICSIFKGRRALGKHSDRMLTDFFKKYHEPLAQD